MLKAEQRCNRGHSVKQNYIDTALHKKATIQYGFLKDEAASLLLQNELEQKIVESLDLLPEKCKKIFVKSRLEGLKHKEIARELGLSHKTALG
ncbi:MAG: hypothetical protein MI921_23525 [Cytophagales bacterium]|nr:hypothetical protein [Cytophagales bacterium]